MAISLVSSVTIPGGANGSTSGAINTTGANLLVACISYLQGATITLSDSLANTWSLIVVKSATNSISHAIYYVNSSTPNVGAAQTFTLTGSSVFSAGKVMSFSGAGGLDQSSGFTTAGGPPAQPGSITPAAANSLFVTGAGTDGAGSTFTVDSGFTITGQTAFTGGTNFGNAGAYLIQGAATALNPTWSWTGANTEYAVAMAVFKPASVAPTFSVSPADVTKIIIYNQNGDGTLSPALTPSAATPVILPTTAIPVQVFNTQNADGTLTSSTVS